MFEMAGGGDAFPTSPLDLPLPAQITMSLTTTPSSRFGFSMMWGKFCHSCFEITARTALAQFGHFTSKTRLWFQNGGFNPPTPLLGAPLWGYQFLCRTLRCLVSSLSLLCGV